MHIRIALAVFSGMFMVWSITFFNRAYQMSQRSKQFVIRFPREEK